MSIPQKHLVSSFRLRKSLPKLNWDSVDWNNASDPSEDYNCVGFAVGDNRWWQPTSGVAGLADDPKNYWPPGVPSADLSVQTYVSALQTAGFEMCEGGSWEDQFEKIALFHEPDGEFKHACLLVADGTWKSKWGDLSDFVHNMQALEGGEYGSICIFMKRARTHPDASARVAS